MNPADLPPELAARPKPLIEAVRAIAQGPLAQQAHAIDRGAYPEAVLKQLAAAGAMGAHLPQADGTPGDFGLAIAAMAEASRVCGATGFMMWCQSVAGLYMQASGNSALAGERLARHLRGESLGGTGLSNPMKSFAKIEALLLKATPVEGGYRINGTLPWVSNLAADHYFGAIAAVSTADESASREIMFMLRCDAPGVTLKACPEFSGMEGTGTFSVHCKDLFVGTDDLVADPAKPFIARIRGGFVLLQCGMAAGIIQGAISSMWAVEGQLGHVNQYLEDRPADLQAEFDALLARIMKLAETPFDASTDYFVNVLDTRSHCAELSLRAANSALLHQGARGYLMQSDVQRRVREAQFVAIVTPAIKHLRKEMARLSAQEMPA
jgi:alkylation response protein AidB-like acyl-CoA dehydrogenase